MCVFMCSRRELSAKIAPSIPTKVVISSELENQISSSASQTAQKKFLLKSIPTEI